MSTFVKFMSIIDQPHYPSATPIALPKIRYITPCTFKLNRSNPPTLSWSIICGTNICVPIKNVSTASGPNAITNLPIIQRFAPQMRSSSNFYTINGYIIIITFIGWAFRLSRSTSRVLRECMQTSHGLTWKSSFQSDSYILLFVL